VKVVRLVDVLAVLKVVPKVVLTVVWTVASTELSKVALMVVLWAV